MPKQNNAMEYKKFNFEVKEVNSDDKFIYIDGYASTNDKDLGDDIVEQGALMKSVESYGYPKFLHQHSHTQMPLGVLESVSTEGNKTLIRTKMPITDRSKEIKALAEMGAYGGFSIGFMSKTVEWQDIDKDQVRVIKELHWYEVSLVSVPMNPNAVVTNVKSIEKVEKLSEVEGILKEKGFSAKESLTIISKIKNLSDTDEKVDPSDLDDEGKPSKKEDVQSDSEDKEKEEALTDCVKAIENLNKILKG